MANHNEHKISGISMSPKSGDSKIENYFQSLFSTPDPSVHGWSPLHTYPLGVELFRQDHPATHVYFIERGIVKLSCGGPGGEEVIAGLRQSNWLLGASAVILGSAYTATATTLTRCSMRWIAAGTFVRKLAVDIDLSAEVNRMLSREIRGHLTKIVTLGCMSATERLRRFLCELISEEDHDELQEKGKLELPLKNGELAQIVAVTPQHLYRLLREPGLRTHLRQRKKILTVVDPLAFIHKNTLQR